MNLWLMLLAVVVTTGAGVAMFLVLAMPRRPRAVPPIPAVVRSAAKPAVHVVRNDLAPLRGGRAARR